MSDEQRKDETDEVEGHLRRPMTEEPSNEGEKDDDVDAHMRVAARTDARTDAHTN